jgi:hypothetical protein
MSIVEYSESMFFSDLEKITDTSDFTKDRLSIVSLLEGFNNTDHFGDAKRVFTKLENKEYFLLVYMFHVLLGQAIYAFNLNNPNIKVSQYKRVPNFCGILSSYAYNFPPFELIEIYSTYIDKDYKKHIEVFKELTDFMFDKFVDIIEDRTEKKNFQRTAVLIFTDIKFSMQFHGRIDSYSQKRKCINREFCKDCETYLHQQSTLCLKILEKI